MNEVLPFPRAGWHVDAPVKTRSIWRKEPATRFLLHLGPRIDHQAKHSGNEREACMQAVEGCEVGSCQAFMAEQNDGNGNTEDRANLSYRLVDRAPHPILILRELRSRCAGQ